MREGWLLKELARIEAGKGGPSEAIKYYECAAKLAETLERREMDNLKVPERSWQLIFKKVKQPTVELVERAVSFYELMGNVLFVTEALRLGAMTIKDVGLGRRALMRLEDQPKRFIEVAKACGLDNDYLMMLIYCKFTKNTLPVSIQEGTLEAILFTDGKVDVHSLKQTILRRLKTIPPDKVSLFLKPIGIALCLSKNNNIAFIEVSVWLQQAVIRPAELLGWITLLMHSVINLPANLWIWSSQILNEAARKLNHPVACHLNLNLNNERQFSRWSFSEQELLNHWAYLCQNTDLQAKIQWDEVSFSLGSEITGLNETRSSQPVGRVKLEGTSEIEERPVSVESLQKEIEQLKLRRELLSQSKSAPPKISLEGIFILDTNILLDYLDTIKTAIRLHRIHCGIPTVVAEELRGLCQCSKRSSAKEALAFLLGNPLGFSSITIHGVVSDTSIGKKDFWPPDGELKSNDDAILYTVSQCPGAILISDDVNLTLKARAHQVDVMSFEQFLQSLG